MSAWGCGQCDVSVLEREGGHLYRETADEKMIDLLCKLGLIM